MEGGILRHPTIHSVPLHSSSDFRSQVRDLGMPLASTDAMGGGVV